MNTITRLSLLLVSLVELSACAPSQSLQANAEDKSGILSEVTQAQGVAVDGNGIGYDGKIYSVYGVCNGQENTAVASVWVPANRAYGYLIRSNCVNLTSPVLITRAQLLYVDDVTLVIQGQTFYSSATVQNQNVADEGTLAPEVVLVNNNNNNNNPKDLVAPSDNPPTDNGNGYDGNNAGP